MPAIEFDNLRFLAHLGAYLGAIPSGERRIVAIAGAPASGKSTLASQLERRLNETNPGSTALLPMDGYHYDDEVLILAAGAHARVRRTRSMSAVLRPHSGV